MSTYMTKFFWKCLLDEWCNGKQIFCDCFLQSRNKTFCCFVVVLNHLLILTWNWSSEIWFAIFSPPAWLYSSNNPKSSSLGLPLYRRRLVFFPKLFSVTFLCILIFKQMYKSYSSLKTSTWNFCYPEVFLGAKDYSTCVGMTVDWKT